MKATPIILGAGALGLLALVIHKTSTPSIVNNIPSVAEILTAEDMTALDGEYEVIGAALESSKITAAEYSILYEAYVQRFYELWGA